MGILLSLLFVFGFISFVAPFVIWAWTNFNKTNEIFGYMRLNFILWSWLICWGFFVFDILIVLLIVL